MIKELERPILGHLGFAIVSHNNQFFNISTVNLVMRRLVDVMAEWRDDWWCPPYPMETMVWKCNSEGERFGDILHCQGYRKSASATKAHKKLCGQIELGGMRALNGRRHQTDKLEKRNLPIGLLRDISRKTKALWD